MRLSKKHKTIYVVVATFHDATIKLIGWPRMEDAENQRKEWKKTWPHAFVQIHTIDQALPEVPKP